MSYIVTKYNKDEYHEWLRYDTHILYYKSNKNGDIEKEFTKILKHMNKHKNDALLDEGDLIREYLFRGRFDNCDSAIKLREELKLRDCSINGTKFNGIKDRSNKDW